MLDSQLQLLDVRSLIRRDDEAIVDQPAHLAPALAEQRHDVDPFGARRLRAPHHVRALTARRVQREPERGAGRDRKSTRLNSSHLVISYAVFCLKKKKKEQNHRTAI